MTLPARLLWLWGIKLHENVLQVMQDHPLDYPFNDSPNLESKDLPHSIDINYVRTKTMR